MNNFKSWFSPDGEDLYIFQLEVVTSCQVLLRLPTLVLHGQALVRMSKVARASGILITILRDLQVVTTSENRKEAAARIDGVINVLDIMFCHLS